MSKYIIEIAEEYEEYFKGVLICGIADGKFAVDVIAREDLEELNSDYINEHFGELQDEAYQKDLEDGKKSVSEPDRIEVGDEVMVASLTDGPLTVVGKDKVLDADGDKAMCYSLLSAKTGTVFEHDVKDHGMDEWETPFKTGRHFDHIDKLLEAMRT